MINLIKKILWRFKNKKINKTERTSYILPIKMFPKKADKKNETFYKKESEDIDRISSKLEIRIQTFNNLEYKKDNTLEVSKIFEGIKGLNISERKMLS